MDDPSSSGMDAVFRRVGAVDVATMPSINVDLDYHDHDKTRRLIELLGPEADALPVRLWCYVGKHHARDGKLTGLAGQQIERRLSWRGRRGQAISALVEAGFLEKIEGGFQVHDWLEHCGHLAKYKERAQKAARARWSKEKGGSDDASSIKNDATSNACEQYSLDAFPGGANGAAGGVRQDVFPGVGYASQEVRDAARRLVAAYQKATGTRHDPRGGAQGAIEILMTAQATEGQLLAAIERFGAHVSKTYADPLMRLSARNFFGGEAPAWLEWLEGSPIVGTNGHKRPAPEVLLARREADKAGEAKAITAEEMRLIIERRRSTKEWTP